MKRIINGHSEDSKFLSDNLTSLLEWCLNYKKRVYFDIETSNAIYSVEIKYDVSSKGHYKRGNYTCYLYITITNVNGQKVYDAVAVNDGNENLTDAVSYFNLNYIATPIREFGE